jgi:hypothetical protein
MTRNMLERTDGLQARQKYSGRNRTFDKYENVDLMFAHQVSDKAVERPVARL